MRFEDFNLIYFLSIGNGYLGLSLSSQSQIHFQTDIRSPFISTGYSPVIQISSDTWEVSSATIVQMKQGLVRRIQCFKFSSERSAFVTHVLYAHRKRSSLIIQEIEITNPSEHTLDLDVQRKKQIDDHDYKQIDQEDIQFDSTKDIYQMTTNQISTRQHNFILFVFITNKILSNIHIKPGRYVYKFNKLLFLHHTNQIFFSQEKQTIFTVVKYSPLLSENSLSNQTFFQQWKDKLRKQAKDDMSDALSTSSIRLLKEHIDTWSLIWQSGFTISRSLAPSAMNGEIINRTIYYVLCSTPSPIYDLNIEESKRNELNQSLFQIDQCYESHSTL